MVLAPMASDGKDAVWSMGDDTPLAPLAHAPRPVYAFFRQRFAQVTNPAIDPVRESIVVQLHTRLGPWPHLLNTSARIPGLSLQSPFLSLGQMHSLRNREHALADEMPLAVLDCVFAPVLQFAPGDRRSMRAGHGPGSGRGSHFVAQRSRHRPARRPRRASFPSPWPWRPEPCITPWSMPGFAPRPAWQ